jgi:uncharacterized caspase-like protein
MSEPDQDYAIVVGIDLYPKDLSKLYAAERDAADFAEWLIAADGGGVPEKNLRLIRGSSFGPFDDPFDFRPIQRDIDRALSTFGVGIRARVGRRLYFYFAGHGLGVKADDVVMLMADASLVRLNSNLGLSKYRHYFRNAAPFEEVLLILDCCRDLNNYVEPIPPSFTALTDYRAAPQVRELTALATGYGRKAFEPSLQLQSEADEGRRGLLTRALLEGLRGQAAGTNGAVTAATLRAYLEDRVPQLARFAELRQQPELNATDPNLLICQVQAPEGWEVRIFPPSAPDGELILLNGSLNEIGRWNPQNGVWIQRLSKGLYEVQHTTTGQERRITVRTGEGQVDVRFA